MDLEAVVTYKGGPATYLIKKEQDLIYSASLKQYDGNVHDIPPINITLTKGLRHWVGSTHLQSLVDGLGNLIDQNLPLFEDSAKSEDPNSMIGRE